MATIHRYIDLFNRDTNRRYRLKLGTIEAIENDYNNGGNINFGNSDGTYEFFMEHQNETFYVNNLNGLRIGVGSEEDAPHFYSDVEFTTKIKRVPITFYVKHENNTNYAINQMYVYPSYSFFSDKNWISGNLDTNSFDKRFLWDLTNNKLFFVGLNYTTTTVIGTKKFIISPDLPKYSRNPHYIGRIVVDDHNPYWYVSVSLSSLNDVSWEYFFTKYKETDNDDIGDEDKQKPIEWQYPEKDPSEPGGGDGDQDDPSDPVQIDDIIDGLSSDFVKLYKITKANLTALSEYMLQDDFLTNIKKLYADPMDAIISLNTFPINATGTAGVITTSGVSTGINAVQITNSIIDIDCGTVTLKEYWGSFLDYETKISLFLPYVGIQSISTDDFMNDIIHVIYRVDLLSGGFVVFVKNSRGIVHQTTGNMAYHMPVTSIDYSRMFSALITGAVGIAGNAATGNAAGAITGTLSTIQNFHPQIQMSGNFGGNTGICSNKKPYLIIERPVPNVPANYSDIKGNTSNVTVTLGNCSGFTQISDMQIKHITATDAEKEQILNLLKSGVYF